jgi:hypothetical protein
MDCENKLYNLTNQQTGKNMLRNINDTNKLYQLIRQRAGTKMLRDAEGINAYDTIDYYLSECDTERAIDVAEAFHKSYPVLQKEEPITVIMLDEIMEMDSEDLKWLPWVYVDMLRALTWNDLYAGALLNEKLKSSPAAAWREPLDTTVENEYAFKKTIDNWWLKNRELVSNVKSWVFNIPCDNCHLSTKTDWSLALPLPLLPASPPLSCQILDFEEECINTCELTRIPLLIRYPLPLQTHLDDSIQHEISEMCADSEFGAYCS